MYWIIGERLLSCLCRRGLVPPTLGGQASMNRSQGIRVMNFFLFAKRGTWHQGPIARKHQSPWHPTHSILPRDPK
uniref:Uncharacterized protein n=2 Tax=Macaca TaxID=9539 RepID=A0A2K6AT64_MACNE|nr:unnamed protein product [Macaca fascicularis]